MNAPQDRYTFRRHQTAAVTKTMTPNVIHDPQQGDFRALRLHVVMHRDDHGQWVHDTTLVACCRPSTTRPGEWRKASYWIPHVTLPDEWKDEEAHLMRLVEENDEYPTVAPLTDEESSYRDSSRIV